jgi:hypothetical protein
MPAPPCGRGPSPYPRPAPFPAPAKPSAPPLYRNTRGVWPPPLPPGLPPSFHLALFPFPPAGAREVGPHPPRARSRTRPTPFSPRGALSSHRPTTPPPQPAPPCEVSWQLVPPCPCPSGSAARAAPARPCRHYPLSFPIPSRPGPGPSLVARPPLLCFTPTSGLPAVLNAASPRARARRCKSGRDPARWRLTHV